jgi:hypothetical protein
LHRRACAPLRVVEPAVASFLARHGVDQCDAFAGAGYDELRVDPASIRVMPVSGRIGGTSFETARVSFMRGRS